MTLLFVTAQTLDLSFEQFYGIVVLVLCDSFSQTSDRILFLFCNFFPRIKIFVLCCSVNKSCFLLFPAQLWF